MIRRQFMKFAPKEHDEKKVKKTLEKHNVPVYEGNAPAKFGQFGNVAKDLAAKHRKQFVTPEGGNVAEADKTFGYQQKALYGGGTGVGTGTVQNADARNPYAIAQPKGNPYAQPSSNGNPYGQSSSSNPYGQSSSSNPYGTAESGNPYARGPERSNHAPASADDEFAASSPYANAGTNPYQSYPQNDSNARASRSPARNDYEPSGYASRGHGSSVSNRSQPGNAPNGQTGGYEASSGVGVSAGVGAGAYGGPSTPNAYGSAPNAYGSAPNAYGSAPNAYGSAPSAYGGGSSAPNAHGSAPNAYRAGPSGSNSAQANDYDQQFTNASKAQPPRPSATDDDFDELNQTHTELEAEAGGDSDDELMHSGASLYGGRPGRAPSVRSMATTSRPMHSAPAPLNGINEQDEDYDELNQMPSEFVSEQNYSSSQQLFEDSEDEDVENVKMEIRQVKQESLASTRRALQIAHEAETSGRNTLGMLGDQSERLGNSAKTVSIGRVQARVAEANADELQRLNRSIFIPNVSNPFNSRRRQQMKEQRLKSERAYDEMEQQSLERMQRESERRVTDGLNGSGEGYNETALRIQQRMNRDNPERKIYQFEADSEDDDMEDELAQNLEGISQAAKRLHGLSLKINDEVTSQNERVEEMGGRVEDLDFHLHKSTAKMSTLH